MRCLATLATLTLALSACGSEDEGTDPTGTKSTTERTTSEEKSEPEKVKSSEIVATCADLTGQDPFATGKPVAGFVACLKRMNAPPDVIEAWGG